MSDLTPVVVILPYHNNRLVFIKRKNDPYSGKFSPVSGHIEPQESVGSGAVRELYEELYSISDKSIRDLLLLYNRHEFRGVASFNETIKGNEYEVYVFRCKIDDPSKFNLLVSEVEDWKYFDEIDLAEMDDSIKHFLEEII